MRDNAKYDSLDCEIDREIKDKLDLIEVWYGIRIDSSQLKWWYEGEF